ncbi:MAG: methylated-DNA--[protein]-cysteine S-methyltransferase [Sutterellaceae bacterium]|nr:methylated-DNA--[protein]-cysteine S-methyltransferase [Sutterellaceae bacterium]
MSSPEVHTYRLPAPFGSIVFAGLGNLGDELFSVRPSLEVVHAPDAAPENICRWINLVDKMLSEYAEPTEDDYAELFRLPAMTERLSEFGRSVLKAVTKIPRNELVTYTELAERVGHPTAARAVAKILADNPFPILIPCHRIVSREQLTKIDITDVKTLAGPAYLGEANLAEIAAWLRLHDQTFV